MILWLRFGDQGVYVCVFVWRLWDLGVVDGSDVGCYCGEVLEGG